MMLNIFGWVLVFMRPSWGFLTFFALCITILAAIFNLFWGASEGALGNPVILMAVAIAAGIDFAVFFAVGAIIVLLRGARKDGGKSPSEKEIDAELARIRAEAAAREQASRTE